LVFSSDLPNPSARQKTLTHELGHHLQMSHICARWDHLSAAQHPGNDYCCVMHYDSLAFMRQSGSMNLDPWVFGHSSDWFCAEHLRTIRNERLEDHMSDLGWVDP
jgi:hypothetical protein